MSEEPNEPRHRRVLARLAEATGHELRALDEYVWLWRRTGRSDDRLRALGLARAQSGLPLVRELLDGERLPAKTPRQKSAAKPRRAATIAGSASRRTSAWSCTKRSATRGQPLWRHKLELELRLGDVQAALLTLAAVVKRFDRREWREQLANLQLNLGKPRAALRRLRAAPSKQQDEA